MAKFLYNLVSSDKETIKYLDNFDDEHHVDKIKKITAPLVYIAEEKQILDNIVAPQKNKAVHKI